MITISFVSANYVARALGYHGDTDWGKNEAATINSMNAAEFTTMIRDIKAAGFDHMDLWMAHCHFEKHPASYHREVKKICADEGMTLTSVAGGLHADKPDDFNKPFAFLREMGIPIVAGGYWGPLAGPNLPEIAAPYLARHEVVWAFENHPEKNVAEIKHKIAGGKYARLGVCFDTGFAGIHGFDAVDAVRELLPMLKIMHLKDVEKPGSHSSCGLGDGVVPVDGVAKYLKKHAWSGNVGIEHEPFNRDPMPEVKASLERVRTWLS